MLPEVDILVEDPRWTDSFSVDALVEKVLGGTLIEIKPDLGAGAEVSFLFCDDDRIAALNGSWRGKASPTNVLSFPVPGGGGPSRMLGDVVLAYDTISREAELEGKSLETHTAHMIVHGFLHLLGFDHIEPEQAGEMEAAESRILLGLGLSDPWAGDKAQTKATLQ
jgi:probable rRNA maturation factor